MRKEKRSQEIFGMKTRKGRIQMIYQGYNVGVRSKIAPVNTKLVWRNEIVRNLAVACNLFNWAKTKIIKKIAAIIL